MPPGKEIRISGVSDIGVSSVVCREPTAPGRVQIVRPGLIEAGRGDVRYLTSAAKGPRDSLEKGIEKNE